MSNYASNTLLFKVLPCSEHKPLQGQYYLNTFASVPSDRAWGCFLHTFFRDQRWSYAETTLGPLQEEAFMKPVINRIDSIPCPQRKSRVAAYCRVSTDRDAQIISLNNQRTHYEAIISARLDWECAGIYCDEGLSGTNKDTRPELMRLMNDCMAGRIDLVITKSISRFSAIRSTA